ncbi:acyltransferase, partial [Singulisphaera rosea]
MTSGITNLRGFLTYSEHPMVRRGRGAYRLLRSFTLPTPRVVTQPMLWGYLTARSVYYFAYRVFVCEPLFKAYCKRYGRRLRTDVFVHFVEGRGDLIVGDDVLIDGKCCFAFTQRFGDRPTLSIGDRSSLGHNSKITVAKSVTIGRDCRIASDVWMFDFSGHPSDPEA